MMQLDPHISIGNLITIGVGIVGAIGGYYTLRQAFKDYRENQEEWQRGIKERLDSMTGEITAGRNKNQDVAMAVAVWGAIKDSLTERLDKLEKIIEGLRGQR